MSSKDNFDNGNFQNGSNGRKYSLSDAYAIPAESSSDSAIRSRQDLGGASVRTSAQARSRVYATGDDSGEDYAYTRWSSGSQVVDPRGASPSVKTKLCPACGGSMKRGSRMFFAPLAGALLCALGLGLMTAYGIASNFMQPPWFVQFALPAAYYIGALFTGVGILVFFLREKVWKCARCWEIRKR